MQFINISQIRQNLSFDEANTNSVGSPITNLFETQIVARQTWAGLYPYSGGPFVANTVPATSANGGGHVNSDAVIYTSVGDFNKFNVWVQHVNTLGHIGDPFGETEIVIDRTDLTLAAPSGTMLNTYSILNGTSVRFPVQYTEPTTLRDGTPLSSDSVNLHHTNYFSQIDNTTPIMSGDIAATSGLGGGVISANIDLVIPDGTSANVKFWATANCTGGPIWDAQQVLLNADPFVPLLLPLLIKTESANSNIAIAFVERSVIPDEPLSFTIS